MGAKKVDFTDEVRREVVRRKARGETNVMIRDWLGISDSTLRRKLGDEIGTGQGKPKVEFTSVDEKMACDMYARGSTFAEVAEVLGKSVSTITTRFGPAMRAARVSVNDGVAGRALEDALEGDSKSTQFWLDRRHPAFNKTVSIEGQVLVGVAAISPELLAGRRALVDQMSPDQAEGLRSGIRELIELAAVSEAKLIQPPKEA